MLVVVAPRESEHVVKRSRFVARIEPVGTEAQALACHDAVRSNHPEANHVVYAYLIGDEASERAGMSDDREPRGTACRPVMAVLRGSGIRNALLTVTRYFGGTKLGTGGLVEAYSLAAKSVVTSCETREFVPRITGRMRVSYELVDAVERLCLAKDVVIVQKTFGVEIDVEVSVPLASRDEFLRLVEEISRGKINVRY